MLCQHCHREAFFVRRGQKYCSDTCRYRARAKREGCKPTPEKRANSQPLPCRLCGRPTRYRFCGRECSIKWQNLKRLGHDMETIDLQEQARFERRWEQLKEEGRVCR